MGGDVGLWSGFNLEDPSDVRLFEAEYLILQATESIAQAMELASVSRSDLARRLGTSRAHITQLLSGSRNMTLRSLADLAWALDMKARIEFVATSMRDSSESARIKWSEHLFSTRDEWGSMADEDPEINSSQETLETAPIGLAA